MGQGSGEASKPIRERVLEARKVQQKRFAGEGIYANAGMQTRHMRRHCALAPEVRDVLKTAIQQIGLSARAYDRILKLGRTIADLAGSEAITRAHVAEAIQYRTMDRKMPE